MATTFTYTVNGDGKTCTVTGTKDFIAFGDIVIPSMIDGYTVTTIGAYAFSCYRDITGVRIPDGVTSIGESAFFNCTSLTSVTIPDSVTSIDDCAFEYCTGLTSVTIPDSVEDIGYNAFSDCCALTSITIPDNVTRIGYGAFERCTSLTNVTIGGGVTGLAEWTFNGCTSLTSVTVPDSIIYICEYVFYGCSSLAEIDFAGTKAQWNNIDKGANWNQRAGDCVVRCADGDISDSHILSFINWYGTKETHVVSRVSIKRPEYDPRFSRDGGSYDQPRYAARVDGVEVVLEDTSCGDFGTRFDIFVGNRRACFGSLLLPEQEGTNLNIRDLKRLRAAAEAWKLSVSDFPSWLSRRLYEEAPRSSRRKQRRQTLYKVNHDLSDDLGVTYTFTGKGDLDLHLGDIVLCYTRRGVTIGRIVDTISSTECPFVPTAGCEALTENNIGLLSAFDRARVILAQTNDIQKALEAFNGYGDRTAITAFVYHNTDAVRIQFYDEYGTRGMNVFVDAYDEQGNWDGEEILFTHNFG